MKYNLVHKLLFVDTNVRDKFIPYFSLAPWFDDLIPDVSKHGVGFYVKPDVSRPNELKQRFDYYWGHKGSKLIYYEHPLLPGIKAKLLLDMSGELPTITVNRWYYRMVNFKFENILPSGLHLTNLIILKLLQNNILTVHCASFSSVKNNAGFLVFGASNTGKSYTTFSALKRGGFQYHSEDLTILDSKFIYTTPLISAHSAQLPEPSLALKYNLFIRSLPIVSLFAPLANARATFRKFMANHNVKAKASIGKIFILERGKDSIVKLDASEAYRKVQILNKLEFSYGRDDLLLAYSYFDKTLDMEQVLQAEAEQLRQVVNTTSCYLVKSSSPGGYLAQIDSVLGS